MLKKIIFFSLLLFALVSCHKKDNRRVEAVQIITEWVGKTIRFSDAISMSVYGKDTLLPDFHSTPYKVLLYVDSMGCTSCKLKLYEWQRLIAEADTILADKLSFIFIFQPKNSDELVYIFRRDRFDYPVYIDKRNEINRLNRFPEKTEYRCFLLDKNNTVVSVGNPALNLRIWDMYKEIISGKLQAESSSKQQIGSGKQQAISSKIHAGKGFDTQVEVLDSVVELRSIKQGEKHNCTFRLKNTGNHPLVISDAKTSCGCTNANWDKKPIEKGKVTEIKVEIKVESKGYFEKTLSVYCNATISPITLTIKGKTTN